MGYVSARKERLSMEGESILSEAICRARFDCGAHPCNSDDTGRCKPGQCRKPACWVDEATTALTALCAALHISPAALDALAAGEAVVVPRVASEAMVRAGSAIIADGGYYASVYTDDAYAAMLAASPYAAPDAEGGA
jgi:hypothetical protein